MKDGSNILSVIEKLKAEGNISREDLAVIRQGVKYWKYGISEGKKGNCTDTFIESIPVRVNMNFNAYARIDEVTGLIREIFYLLSPIDSSDKGDHEFE